MNNLQTILVVMSPLRIATPAPHRAAAYARRANAVLHLCLFDHYGPIDYSSAIFGAEVAERARRDFLEERMQWLAEQAIGLAGQGFRVECDAIWAPDPGKALVAKALEIRADLVVMDLAGPVAAGSGLRASGLDWKLARLCPAPLMLVRPGAQMLPRHLLAAVDVTMAGEEGQLNDRVVEASQSCAVLSEADLHLASIFSYVTLDTYGSGFIADTYAIMDTAHAESLAKFAARHQVEPGQVLRRNAIDVAQGIADCAGNCGADLVVLGSAYRSGLDRLLFGSSAEALLRQLACDVLLIKPEGFEDELAGQVKLPDHHSSRDASKARNELPVPEPAASRPGNRERPAWLLSFERAAG